MHRDTDGYIIIDMKGIDVSRASQSVPGLYEKVEPVLDANKLVIVNNAGNHTPLPGSCIKSSNYIRITTDIYIFTINSNNILIIEANGSSITVDVSIIPAYSEGTKIADFEINGQSGEIYIPAYPDIINDSVASDHTVYSSDKVNTLLSGKADTSAIPTKTSDLDNDSGFITSSDIPVIPDILNDLLDVDITSASDAQVLTYDAISGKWVNATSPSGVTELSQLSDVTIASASDGNVLTYDSTSGKWVNEAPSGVTTLDGLSDVSLTTPASGNALVYDGTKWVNDTIDATDIPYSAGVSVSDKINEIVANANTVNQYTASYTNASINQGNIYAYSIGKIYMLTGYMRANAQIASDTVIGSVTGVTLTNEIFASSIGSSGSTLRLMSYTDGRFRIEKTMPANEWFSYTIVGFLA